VAGDLHRDEPITDRVTDQRRPSTPWSERLFRWPWIAAFFLAAFLLRMALSVRYYWDEDARQIYLLGLKWFTTGAWPYFGPDVVYTQSQIPGALQGILVGGPLFLAPIPEAPLVLVNLLSMGALGLLAWYVCRRLPGLPVWIVWSWIFLAPWALFRTVRTMNPDYVLFGAVLVWIGVFETAPALRRRILPQALAAAMMGFGLLWIMQLHLSWPVLVPVLAWALGRAVWVQGRQAWPVLAGFVAGATLPAALLVPTFAVHGLSQGLGGTEGNVVTLSGNVVTVFLSVVGRFVSFASYELPYWTGGGTFGRWEFYRHLPWAIPAGAVLLVMSFLQPAVLIIEGFRTKPHAEWPTVRALALAVVIIVSLAFLFSVKGPSSHAFYLAFPLAVIYSMYVWEPYLTRVRWRRVAAVTILAAGLMSVAHLFEHHPSRSFAVDRDAVARAIAAKDYRMLGERRSTVWGCCY
jgi:hypothetical protein